MNYKEIKECKVDQFIIFSDKLSINLEKRIENNDEDQTQKKYLYMDSLDINKNTVLKKISDNRGNVTNEQRVDKIRDKNSIYLMSKREFLINDEIFQIRNNLLIWIYRHKNCLKEFFKENNFMGKNCNNKNELLLMYYFVFFLLNLEKIELINMREKQVLEINSLIEDFLNSKKSKDLLFLDNEIEYLRLSELNLLRNISKKLNFEKYLIDKYISNYDIKTSMSLINSFFSEENLLTSGLIIRNHNNLSFQFLERLIRNKTRMKNKSNFKRICTRILNTSLILPVINNSLKIGNKDSNFNKSYENNNKSLNFNDKKEVNNETANLNKCSSNCLFFFNPHKYRKSVGIIVPKILSYKYNSKKSKNSEKNDKMKLVRFNCSMISPDRSKNSINNCVETPRKHKISFCKESKIIKKNGNIDYKDIEFKKGIESLNKSITFNDTSKSNLLILDEDIISMEFIENKNFELNSYLTNIEEFNDFNKYNTNLRNNINNVFIDTEELIISKYNNRNKIRDSCIFDDESSKLVSLDDIDPINGCLKPIKWWFNHSIRHIVIKLNCIDNFCRINNDIEIIPLIHPLITGYLNQEISNKSSSDSKMLNLSTHVLLGLKSVDINSLKPSKKEFSRISAFCFKEMNNIIPIALQEFKIVQSIIPISIFSILLTRFPVPAANTFIFSFICNDDYLPNTGMQTIKIIKLELTQNSCNYYRKRNKSNNKNLNIFNESICNHIHLDIFRKYNNIKICPWLAISNFIDEFILRTPIPVKCIIDIRNIMIISSRKNLIEKKENDIVFEKNQEFVILTLNLMLPLLIIQSHSIQNIIIGHNNDPLNKNIYDSFLKLRIDSAIFSVKYLPFHFYNIRNLDLLLDFNIDKTELGSLILNKYYKSINSYKFVPNNQKKCIQINSNPNGNCCFIQLYDIIDNWIEEFIFWFDKYVNNCIEFLSINLYVTSRSLELKTNNCPNIELENESYSNFFDFNPLNQKFINNSKINHNQLNSVSIKIYFSNNIKYFIFNCAGDLSSAS